MHATNARMATAIALLASSVLLFGPPVNAGHAPCSTLVRYPACGPVEVDQKYMRVSVGSFDKCLERVNYSLAPGDLVFIPPPSPPFGQPDPALVARVIPLVTSMLNRTVSLRHDLDSRLTLGIRQVARQHGLTVSYAHGRVTGPISFSLLGQPDSNGVLRVRIGFGMDMVAKGRKRGITGYVLRGQITVRGANLSLSANYNVNSGVVSGLALAGGSIRVDVDARFLSVFRVRFNFGSQQLLPLVNSHLGAHSATVFGLDDDIPAGAFVHNGTDYGLRIKRHLADFVETVDVTITQGGKRLSDAYLNVSVGNIHLTAGSIERSEGVRPRSRLLCAPN